jgi:hypothetical protein
MPWEHSALSLLDRGPGLVRARASATEPPAWLAWMTTPLEAALHVVGDLEL